MFFFPWCSVEVERLAHAFMPQTSLGRLRRVLGQLVFCEAEQRFLLLFLEKEENCQCINLLNSKFARSGLRRVRLASMTQLM
jgi:hypothetical protein